MRPITLTEMLAAGARDFCWVRMRTPRPQALHVVMRHADASSNSGHASLAPMRQVNPDERPGGKAISDSGHSPIPNGAFLYTFDDGQQAFYSLWTGAPRPAIGDDDNQSADLVIPSRQSSTTSSASPGDFQYGADLREVR
jgi:hypothetical protein